MIQGNININSSRFELLYILRIKIGSLFIEMAYISIFFFYIMENMLNFIVNFKQ